MSCGDEAKHADSTSGSESSTQTSVGEAGDVRGTFIRTFLTDGLPLQVPADELRLFVPGAEGGVIRTAKVQDDASFLVPNMPAGPYAIYSDVNSPRFEFTAGERMIEVLQGQRGRPDRKQLENGDSFDFAINSPNAPVFPQGGLILVSSRGAALQISLGIGDGQEGTAVDELIWEQVGEAGDGLADTSAGDRLLLRVLGTTDLGAVTCYAPTHAGEAAPITMQANTLNTVDVTFAPVQAKIREFQADVSALHALVGALVPNSQPTELGVHTYARFGTAEHGQFDWMSGCYADEVIRERQRFLLSVEDVAPASEVRYVSVRSSYQTGLVRPSDMGASVDSYTAIINFPVALLGNESNLSLPLAAVATNLRVVPSADASAALPYGTTPTIAWDGPSDGSEASYVVGLLQVDASGVEYIANFQTSATSVTVPPNLLRVKDFAVQILTRNWTPKNGGWQLPTDRVTTEIPTLWASAGTIPLIEETDETDETGDTSGSTDTTDSDSGIDSDWPDSEGDDSWPDESTSTTASDTDTTVDTDSSTVENSSTSSDTSSTEDTFITIVGRSVDVYVGDDSKTARTAKSMSIQTRNSFGPQSIAVDVQSDGTFMFSEDAPFPWGIRKEFADSRGYGYTFAKTTIDISAFVGGRPDRHGSGGAAELEIHGKGVRDIQAGDTLFAFSHGAHVSGLTALSTSQTNLANGVAMELDAPDDLPSDLVSGAKGDVLWLMYREETASTQGAGVCASLAYTAAQRSLELTSTSLPQVTNPAFVPRTGPSAHAIADVAALQGALAAGNSPVTFTHTQLSSIISPLRTTDSPSYLQSTCTFSNSTTSAEATLPMSNQWTSGWIGGISLDVVGTVRVGNDDLEVRASTTAWQAAASDALDVMLAAPGSGVQDIRVEVSNPATGDRVLTWDVPSGEKPIGYWVTRIAGQSVHPYRVFTSEPRFELRPQRFNPGDRITFVVKSIYGTMDRTRPFGEAQITGSVENVSRIFRGDELEAYPRTSRQALQGTPAPAPGPRKHDERRADDAGSTTPPRFVRNTTARLRRSR